MIIKHLHLNPEYTDYVEHIVMSRWHLCNFDCKIEVMRWLRNINNSACFVATINDKPVGTGVFETISDVDYNIPAWNTLLWIDSEHRGHGYGQMLTNIRFDWAKFKGFKTVYLDTHDAKDYHLKHGWSIVREVIYDGKKTYIMKHELT